MAQKLIRGFLARKQHQPRFRGITKINEIKCNMTQMEQIANQLKNDKDSMLVHIKDIQKAVDMAIQKIKVLKKFFNCYCVMYIKILNSFRIIPK